MGNVLCRMIQYIDGSCIFAPYRFILVSEYQMVKDRTSMRKLCVHTDVELLVEQSTLYHDKRSIQAGNCTPGWSGI